MNIALFSDTYFPEVNGVATSVMSLCNTLKSKGHKVVVVTTTGEKQTTFKNNILGIPGLELKKLYGYRAAFIYNTKAFKILKSLKLDIVHVNTEFGIGQFGHIFATKQKLPLVYTYHTMYEDYTYYANKGYFDRFSKWVIREFTRASLDRATEIIAPSSKTEIYLRSIGIDRTINIVPTGFDFTPFNIEKDESIKELKRSIGFNDDDYILLCLGRIAHEKSFDVIIEGYKNYLDSVDRKLDKTKMLFVGSGPSEESLKKLVDNYNMNDKVKFLGKVLLTDVPKYYALSDLFLNASITETQGLTFMEAMASRVVILCRYDTNLLNVINNKVTGFFFKNVDDFKYKLKEIMETDKETLDTVKENAYNSIELFSSNSFYKNIMEVYKSAIRKNW